MSLWVLVVNYMMSNKREFYIMIMMRICTIWNYRYKLTKLMNYHQRIMILVTIKSNISTTFVSVFIDFVSKHK